MQLAEHRMKSIVELLEQWGSEKMYSETAKLLLNHEAEVGKDASVNRVLQLASRNGHQRVLKLFLDMRVVQLFLNTSANRPAPGSGVTYPPQNPTQLGSGFTGPSRNPTKAMSSGSSIWENIKCLI